MAKFSKRDRDVLDAAFEVCHTVSEHCKDVLAGSENQEGSDKELLDKSEKYIKWYKLNRNK